MDRWMDRWIDGRKGRKGGCMDGPTDGNTLLQFRGCFGRYNRKMCLYLFPFPQGRRAADTPGASSLIFESNNN